MRYEYFQPKPDEYGRNMLVLGVDKPHEREYELVWIGDVYPGPSVETSDVLEDIWKNHNSDFNLYRPRRKEIRSMCEGDVIVINGDVWMASRIGFVKLVGEFLPKVLDKSTWTV